MTAAGGSVDIAGLLLARGAFVDVNLEGSITPLHDAAFFDQSCVVQFLDNGADTTALRVLGATALHEVIPNKHDL
jgi:ankyrin repeat protein